MKELWEWGAGEEIGASKVLAEEGDEGRYWGGWEIIGVGS